MHIHQSTSMHKHKHMRPHAHTSEYPKFQRSHLLTSCVSARGKDGKLFILDTFRRDPDRTVALLCNDLPISESGSHRPDGWQIGRSWPQLVSETGDECVEIVKSILSKYQDSVAKCHELAYCRDRYGRLVFDIATPKCRAAIQEMLLFFKRYRLEECKHTSSTSVVYFAVDCQNSASAKDEKRVALKFIRQPDHFNREKKAYERVGNADSKSYVVDVICTHGETGDGDQDALFAESVLRLSAAEKKELGHHCIVLERADRYAVCSSA